MVYKIRRVDTDNSNNVICGYVRKNGEGPRFMTTLRWKLDYNILINHPFCLYPYFPINPDWAVFFFLVCGVLNKDKDLCWNGDWIHWNMWDMTYGDLCQMIWHCEPLCNFKIQDVCSCIIYIIYIYILIMLEKKDMHKTVEECV